MDVPNGSALQSYSKGRREDESLSMQELGEKYQGVKTLEYMIRETYNNSLDRLPSEVSVAQEMQDITGNAYSVPPWSILAPSDGLESESLVESLAEETGHNLDKLNRRTLNLDDDLLSAYREFAAAAFRDEIFEGNIEALVGEYRDVSDEIDDFYDTKTVVQTIQSDIENVLPLIEQTLEAAERVNWDLELSRTYEQVLRERVSEEPPEISKLNGEGYAVLPTPIIKYQREVIPQDWTAGGIRDYEDPKDKIEDIREDAALDQEDFAQKYSGLIEEIQSEAREQVGFDIPHVVGREIWVRNSEKLDAQHVIEMPDSELERLIEEQSEQIIEEYDLSSLTNNQSNQI